MQAATDVLARPVLEAGALTVTWGDVVAAATAWGAWAEHVAATDARHAALAAASGAGPGDAEVHAALVAFRRDRRLLSADETQAWLDRWGLRLAAVREHLRAGLAEAESPQPATPAGDEAVWTAAVCDGLLDDLAEQVAQGLAAMAEPSADWPAVAAARERLIGEVLASAAPARAATDGGLGWQLVRASTLPLDGPDAVAEALACLRDDGLDLDDVAARAGRPACETSGFLDAAPADLHPWLMSAVPGEAVAVAERCEVVVLRDRRPAALDEPDVRARAERVAVLAALRRAVDQKVRWHVHA